MLKCLLIKLNYSSSKEKDYLEYKSPIALKYTDKYEEDLIKRINKRIENINAETPSMSLKNRYNRCNNTNFQTLRQLNIEDFNDSHYSNHMTDTDIDHNNKINFINNSAYDYSTTIKSDKLDNTSYYMSKNKINNGNNLSSINRIQAQFKNEEFNRNMLNLRKKLDEINKGKLIFI